MCTSNDFSVAVVSTPNKLKEDPKMDTIISFPTSNNAGSSTNSYDVIKSIGKSLKGKIPAQVLKLYDISANDVKLLDILHETGYEVIPVSIPDIVVLKSGHKRYISKFEEYALIAEVQYMAKIGSGEDSALRKLLEAYSSYITNIVLSLHINNVRDREDYLCEAQEYFYSAVLKFDFSRGIRIVPYAGHYVRGYIMVSMSRNRTVKIPREHMPKLKVLWSILRGKGDLAEAATVEELAKAIHTSVAITKDLIPYALGILSLETLSSYGETIDKDIEDILGFSPALGDAPQDPCHQALVSDTSDILHQAIMGLSHDERLAISYHYGFNDGHVYSYRDLANLLSGLSKTTVSQRSVEKLLSGATERIKEMLYDKGLTSIDSFEFA